MIEALLASAFLAVGWFLFARWRGKEKEGISPVQHPIEEKEGLLIKICDEINDLAPKYGLPLLDWCVSYPPFTTK